MESENLGPAMTQSRTEELGRSNSREIQELKARVAKLEETCAMLTQRSFSKYAGR